MKKVSLINELAPGKTGADWLKIKSDNILGKVVDVGVFEGTALAYIEDTSQIHILPQHELWFRIQKN